MSVVELKDLLPSAPEEGLSFQVFYDSICSNLRQTSTVQDVLNDFQKLDTDYERVKYTSKLPELIEFSLKENYSRKNAEEASSFEGGYNMLIRNENAASKAHEMISKSIQKTPIEDKSDLAVRYMKRAWSHLLLQNFDSAFIDATRTQTYDVPNPLIWNSYEILGYCHAHRKDFKNAEKLLLNALEYLRLSSVTNELKATVTGRIMTVFKTVRSSKGKKQKHVPEPEHMDPLVSVSYGPHKVLKNVSSAVDVVDVEGSGRCVIANRNIKPGDIIMVDKAYTCVLMEDHYKTHCFHCFKKAYTPIPCNNCAKVWFCDEKCRDTAWSIHKFECSVINHLNDEALGKMSMLVFRIMVTITWDKLQKNRDIIEAKIEQENTAEESKICEDQESVEESVPNATKTKWKWEGPYLYNDYKTVFNLVSNDKKRTFGDLFKRSLAALYVAKCLEISKYLGEDYTEDDTLYVASLVLRHMQSCSCNAYGVSEYEVLPNEEAPQLNEIGGAIYTSISLTNHSCFANTARYNIGTSCILRATRSIPAGQEVFDNYGYLFNTIPIETRNAGLLNQYKFNCDCPACSNEWEMYPHNEEVPLVFKCPGPSCGKPIPYSVLNFIKCPECNNKQQFNKLIKDISKQIEMYREAMTKIQTNDRHISLKLLLDHQSFLDKHVVPPCKQYTDTQEAIGYCYYFQGNVVLPKIKPL